MSNLNTPRLKPPWVQHYTLYIYYISIDRWPRINTDTLCCSRRYLARPGRKEGHIRSYINRRLGISFVEYWVRGDWWSINSIYSGFHKYNTYMYYFVLPILHIMAEIAIQNLLYCRCTTTHVYGSILQCTTTTTRISRDKINVRGENIEKANWGRRIDHVIWISFRNAIHFLVRTIHILKDGALKETVFKQQF